MMTVGSKHQGTISSGRHSVGPGISNFEKARTDVVYFTNRE